MDDRAWTQAQRLHASRLFRTASAEHAYALILAGAELGLGPTTALTQIAVISGRPTLGAALVAALLKRSGRYDYRVEQLDDQVCRIRFLRRLRGGTEGDGWAPLGESVFSLDDARRAGLAASPTWQRFPRNLLWARALTNGTRWYAADVLAGAAYTPEELDAGEAEAADAPEAPEIVAGAPEAPTLDWLVAEYGEAAILAANGGAIPTTTEELLRVAEDLDHAWAAEAPPEAQATPSGAPAEEPVAAEPVEASAGTPASE